MEEKRKKIQRAKSGPTLKRPGSARRRSSTFRPTLFYPRGVVDKITEESKKSTLEGLPVGILLSVFSYLLTEDLLSVCLTSRLLYLPGAMLLYERITITDDMEMLLAVRNAVRHPHRYLGTFIHASKVGTLLAVLNNNKKISDNVKSLAIVGHNDIWQDGGQREEFTKYMHTARLNEFLCPALEFSNVNPIALKPNLQSIKKLALPLRMTEVLQQSLPNLKYLKIFYHNEHGEEIAFRSLAHTLSQSYSKLTAIEFLMFKTSPNSLKTLNNINQNYDEATWICFFDELRSSKKRVEITNLSLDGFISNKGRLIAEMINHATDLSLLCNLQLHVHESSHSHTAHFEIDTTLLSNITKFTPNLQSLACNPTYDCLFCQHTALLRCISKRLPNKLLNLSINYESPNLAYSVLVEEAIKSSQANLRRLRLFDRAMESTDKILLSKFIHPSHMTTYDRAAYYGVTINLILAQIFYSYESKMSYFVANDFKLQLIEQEQKGIMEFIRSHLKREHQDGDRVEEFFASFPHLELLSIFNVDLYFKKGVPSFITSDGYL